MKVLIWIMTFVIGSILNTLLGYAIGIKAGAVLLYIVEFYIAKKLCEKWDQHKNQRQSTNKSSQTVEEKPKPIAVEVERDTFSKLPERKIQYCRSCGSKLIDGSEFCSNCGTQIEKGDAQ